jgi:hypothetical protein
MYYNSDNKMKTESSFFPTFNYIHLLVFFNSIVVYFENVYNTIYRLFSAVANELSGINNIWCIKQNSAYPIQITQYIRDERNNITYYYDSSVKYLMLADTYFSKMYFNNEEYFSLKKMSIFVKAGNKEYFMDEWLRDFKFEINSSNEMISPWLLLNLWSLYSHIWISFCDKPVITIITDDGDIVEFDLLNLDYNEWDRLFLGYSEEETVAEKVEEQIEEKIVEQVVETVAEKVVETVAEKVEEQVEEKIVEQVAEKVAEKIVEQVAEKVAENVVEQVEEQVAETVAEKVEVEEKIVEQVAETVVETVVEQVAETVAENVAEQVEVEKEEINDISTAANAINSVEKVIQQLRQVEEETKKRNEERRMNNKIESSE